MEGRLDNRSTWVEKSGGSGNVVRGQEWKK